MIDLEKKILAVRQQIQSACNDAKRKKDDVLLLAVSKTHAFEKILQARDYGLTDFGENYLQEALGKIKNIQEHDLKHSTNPKINWHFIGHIQSNKTKLIAENFSWVHTVDRLKVLKRLNEQRPKSLGKLNICLEINLNHEPSKSGFLVDDLTALDACIEYANTAENLNLRGLMCIPKAEEDSKKQYANFLNMRLLLDQINRQYHLTLDTLSMGMSHDFKEAILAGATILRIGSLIFGQRDTKK